VGDYGGTDCSPDLLEQRQLWRYPLDGPSAETAIACGLRALRTGERLSRSVAASAQFANPCTDDLTLAEVGGVSTKLTAPEFCPAMKRNRIFEFITHWSDPLFADQIQDGEQPAADVIHKMDSETFTVAGVADLDRCYARLHRFT